jgi:tRNA1(Val) A37 N6-methylase TrmN6
MLEQIHSKLVVLMTSVTLFGKRLLSYIPSMIYDALISDTITNYSYERMLMLINRQPLPKDRPMRMLDIGVGTAVPLFNIWNRLPKNMEVTGVDIDHSYITKAQR